MRTRLVRTLVMSLLICTPLLVSAEQPKGTTADASDPVVVATGHIESAIQFIGAALILRKSGETLTPGEEKQLREARAFVQELLPESSRKSQDTLGDRPALQKVIDELMAELAELKSIELLALARNVLLSIEDAGTSRVPAKETGKGTQEGPGPSPEPAIQSCESRITYEGRLYWQVSWQAVVQNPRSTSIALNLTIKAKDADGFVLGSDTVFGILLPAGGTKDLDGALLLSPKVAENFSRIACTVEVRK